MKSEIAEQRISNEILEFLESQRTLNLSTLDEDGHPYASYAPFAIGDDCFYILVSDIAVHGLNLKRNSKAAVLIVQDESQADTIFARVRVNYQISAAHIAHQTEEFESGLAILAARQGERIEQLAALNDFNLFRLTPLNGRYVKNFGKAFSITGNTLTGDSIDHLRDGHKPRKAAV
ncbi:HugZ family protein [Echinimonas agarilytica]|uniref:Pyridoxamine 5'-phosphate oxidase family protein n=1 Tax=Echinimonas agarilytica TaxID=1215918 RepID=A0AA41W692_9GAMM|nr:pyridoxamine 5'-phosphate oxidase family protein [Echinimonas agarilytica]MCM2679595.1 pyridoxamine 5'-phosphate oxidase family protein [Echinimonas agarilytica]